VSSTRLDCGEAGPGGWMRRAASDESGQVLVMTAVAMTTLIIMVGLVVDVGHAMLVQRQLQAGVDAAALAGVQHLPDAPTAESVAMQYSATPGSKNAVNTVGNAVTSAKVSCIQGVPGCNRRDGGVNGITVHSQSKVPTWFGRIIGITELTVNATATACSPCSVKPLDIMIVLDRTGSMCTPVACSGANQSDLYFAKEGVKTFLSFLDPSIDRVGLALLPPVLDQSWRSNCGNPVGSGYKPWSGTPNPNVPSGHPDRNIDGRYNGYDAYWPRYIGSGNPTPSWYTVASMEGAGAGDPNPQNAYVVNLGGTWWVNDGQNGTNGQNALVQRLGCAGGAGTTHYAFALEEAQYELVDRGRANADNVIIFLSDGAANTMPQNVANGHWSQNGPGGWIQRPCGAGVHAASLAKAAGTVIYTIGYDLDGTTGTPERCQQPDAFGHHNGSNPTETGCSAWDFTPLDGCDAQSALEAMASGPQFFYNQPVPGDLNAIFTQVAMDLAGSKGRLIDNTSPNLP
jgi:hypothetical protein